MTKFDKDVRLEGEVEPEWSGFKVLRNVVCVSKVEEKEMKSP